MTKRLLFPIGSFLVFWLALAVWAGPARAAEGGGDCNHKVCTAFGCRTAQSPPYAYCWSYMETCGWDWCG
jgi:hypothetical protein